jgi:hypothetical protein
MLRPVLTHGGIPSLHHDWQFPADAIQAKGQLLRLTGALNDTNFGNPNLYSNAAPLWAIIWGFERLMPATAAVRVLLAVILLTAWVGMGSLLRAYGASRLSGGAASLVYVCSPVVANQLAAGHLADLSAYASAPAFIACALRFADRRSTGAACGAAVFAVLCAVQIQFAVIVPIVAAIVLFEWTPANRPRMLRTAAMIVLPVLLLPLTWAAFITGNPAQAVSLDRTTLFWELVNSAPIGAAAAMGGYVVDYFRYAPWPTLDVQTLAMWGVWAGVLASLALPRYRRFAALAIAGVVLQSGSHGPAALPITWSFQHISELSVFREFYHFATITAFGLACTIGLWRAQFSLAALLLAVGVALPQLTGAFWNGVSFHNGGSIARAAAIVNADRRASYMLMWPPLQPMGTDAHHAGADPDGLPIGAHGVLTDFVPEAPLVQIAQQLAHEPAASRAATLRSYSIGYVYERPTWQSQYEHILEPRLRAFARAHQPQLAFSNALFDRVPGLTRLVSGPDGVLYRVKKPLPLTRERAFTDIARFDVTPPDMDDRVDPRLGWTDALRWFWLVPSTRPVVNPGMLTASARTHVDALAGTALVLSASGSAQLETAGVRYRIERGGFHAYRLLGPRATVKIRSGIVDDAGIVRGLARASSTSTEVLLRRSVVLGIAPGCPASPVRADRWDWQFTRREPAACIVDLTAARLAVPVFMQRALWALEILAALVAATALLRSLLVALRIRNEQG